MIRKTLFWSHLILGIATGLMVLVMCVTGVLSAYQRQIQTYLNHLGVMSRSTAANAEPLSLDTLAERVREAEGEEPRSISVPADGTGPVEVSFERKGTVYLDAYSGTVIGRPSQAVFKFFGQVNAWHRAMGANGRNRAMGVAVMDAANFVCFLLVAGGIFLWLPRRWTWTHVRAVLVFRPNLSGKARDFNWHNVIGFWMLVPLAVMVWTGVALSYRWADRITVQALGQPERRQCAPAAPAFAFASEPDPFELRVAGLDPLLREAKGKLGDWRRIEVEIPGSIADPVNFAADLSGYGAPGQTRRLQLERDGTVLSLREDSLRGRSVYRFAHTGELWGVAGQTVAMLGCLGGVFLVYTGTALSIRRYAAWRSRKRKRKEKNATNETRKYQPDWATVRNS